MTLTDTRANARPDSFKRLIGLAVAAAVPAAPAAGQSRTSDNAITQAQDAFGYTVGRESLGIYDSDNARGFSPTAAGNIRIEGLYFAPAVGLSPLLIESQSIKIGISAQGYPFAAPSGIVDQTLRRPSSDAGASIIANTDSFGTAGIEADASLPVTRSLGLQIGLNSAFNHFSDGTNNFYHREMLLARWRPAPAIEIVPFWSLFNDFDNEASPVYLPAGDFLPPQPRGGHFPGPWWEDLRSTSSNAGLLSSIAVARSWQFRIGLFRSLIDQWRGFTYLISDIDPNGFGDRQIIVDPPRRNASLSGEARLTHSIAEGPRLHTIDFSLRGRDTRRQFGGSDTIDLGESSIFQDVNPRRPHFAFGPLSRDRIRQAIYGVAYDVRWKEVGEASASLSRTTYRKSTVTPELELESRSNPWLYNGTLTVFPLHRAAVYGGYARGLEESGTPPPNAANRNQALPPIMTRQIEAGVRTDLAANLKAVAGVFSLSRPYFGFDAANRYVSIGSLRSRGAEFSVSGQITDGLDIVAGGVLLDPVVTAASAAAPVGRRPVGIPRHILSLDANWRVPKVRGVSLDASLSHRGTIASTIDNRVEVPARARLDLGGRYQFRLAKLNAAARLQVANVLDARGFGVDGPGAYSPYGPRSASAYLTVDL
jgi:iron complex outermembrane recepter protein